jgi:hypothetical protein
MGTSKMQSTNNRVMGRSFYSHLSHFKSRLEALEGTGLSFYLSA